MKKLLLVSAFSSALILSACGSSDDVAQIIDDEFVTVSGQTTDINDTPSPLPDVAIEGVYTVPDGLLNPTTISDATSGNFSLSVIKGDAFYLHASKDTYATMNSVKDALSANEAGLEIGLPTKDEANQVITLAFASNTPDLAEKAWLVVGVEDANGDEVNGATISPSPAPEAFVYTDCHGADVANSVTEAACIDERPGPMYIAYYAANTEITVTVGSETQTAPIRMGEITLLEFEQ